MKISTSKKVLALTVGMLMTCAAGMQAKLTKPSGGSSSANLVISKVFYAGSKTLSENKNYQLHLYVELYNNSADTLDLSGLYVAFPNSDGGNAAWTAAAMAEEHKDSVVVKQIFRIPDETFRLDPGQSVVIANAAIDHSETAAGGVDLSGADFEIKSENKTYKDSHNDQVATLQLVSTFGTTDFMNLLNVGPSAVILLAADTKVDQCPKTFAKGKTSGSEYTILPLFKTIDCVDIVKQKTPSADDKRIADNYDAGFTHTAAEGSFTGEAVMRKTAYITKDGRKVLFDTNNSSVDFLSTSDLSLRNYSDEVAGLSDVDIVIPESGFLAINMEKPFCGPANLMFCYLNATNNAATTDMTYYTFPGDSLLLIKGPWIAVGTPGSHTLKVSESQGVMKTRSSGMAWSDEDSKTLSQSNRMIYKFQSAADKVGFKRVPAVEGKYNSATFSDGDRLYYTITEAIGDKIAAANGATDHTDLDFIQWHGTTPQQITDGICELKAAKRQENAVYDLQGRRVVGTPRHGLYIMNGKKVLF